MTDEDFYHTCAIRAMEILLSKVPVPSLPGGNQDMFARQQFVRGIARDSFEVALSMLQEKRSYPLPTVEIAGQIGRPVSAQVLGASMGIDIVREELPAITPG